MASLNLDDVRQYVNANIAVFHSNRLARLNSLRLNDILKRKNPYLFKAKNILTAQDLIKGILDAYLSSQEETTFGDFLEGLALFVCGKVYGGRGSPAEGIDLEFTKDNVTYLVAIKSGPNWGNSSQIRRMKDDFKRAKKILAGRAGSRHIEFINGCCYGIDNKPEKVDYLKLCGQRFWELISGDAELYVKIIEPLGHKAKEKNSDFLIEYSRIINIFTVEFSERFCEDGVINWRKLVEFNSKKD
jgi:hypothetical protein